MPTKAGKTKSRRRQVRQQRTRTSVSRWSRLVSALFSWPVMTGFLFVVAASAIALLGEETLRLSVGERIDQPIYAQVNFQVLDSKQTEEAKRVARAKTPSYYKPKPELSADRMRADLRSLHQAAISADDFEAFKTAVEGPQWPVEERAYRRLHELADDKGRERFEKWVDEIPFQTEYVVADLFSEAREPPSIATLIRVATAATEGGETVVDVPHTDLVSQASEKLLAGSAARLAKPFPYELRSTIEAILLNTLRTQPTIEYDPERTTAEMQLAETDTPEVYITYRKGEPYINPLTADGDGRLTNRQYELAELHRAAHLDFLKTPDAAQERKTRALQRVGTVAFVALLSIALFVYTGMHQKRILENPPRTLAFIVLMLGMLLTARLLDLKWPQIPELVLMPALAAGSALAIVYPRRFALGVMCIAAALMIATLNGSFALLLTVLRLCGRGAGGSAGVGFRRVARGRRCRLCAAGGVFRLRRAALYRTRL